MARCVCGAVVPCVLAARGGSAVCELGSLVACGAGEGVQDSWDHRGISSPRRRSGPGGPIQSDNQDAGLVMEDVGEPVQRADEGGLQDISREGKKKRPGPTDRAASTKKRKKMKKGDAIDELFAGL